MAIRAFTSQLEDQAAGRSIDDDAPFGLRQEFTDAACHVLEAAPDFSEARLYKIVAQSLGTAPSGAPYGGYRYAIGRDVGRTEWQRVYDLICRLWPEVPLHSRDDYRIAVNRILAAYRVA